ncbi:O-methyltransferase MdmC [Apiospora kogelbergensis]|uniref:O-methyltransferase MdmC n=1 Tax=Apiospora kogelbergensis TaxID=1337665 RepID=UPI00313230E9
MESGEPVLYPNKTIAGLVTEYAKEHSASLPEYLLNYHDNVVVNQLGAHMMISTFQGQAMVWIARLIGAKKVLEIGVFHGFSCMVWAHAVGEDGLVTGLESDLEYAAKAVNSFDLYSANNIRIVTGDALTTLSQQVPNPASTLDENDADRKGRQQQQEPYDIVFIDAQKSGYPEYLRTILENPPASAEGDDGSSNKRLLRKGGLIIGDNALRWGGVVNDSQLNTIAHQQRQNFRQRDWENELVKLREFNREMKENPRLEAWLCPLWDGLIMARLKD